jgi:hypothetical protein
MMQQVSEKQEQVKLKISRKKEIIKEINETESKRIIQRNKELIL